MSKVEKIIPSGNSDKNQLIDLISWSFWNKLLWLISGEKKLTKLEKEVIVNETITQELTDFYNSNKWIIEEYFGIKLNDDFKNYNFKSWEIIVDENMLIWYGYVKNKEVGNQKHDFYLLEKPKSMYIKLNTRPPVLRFIYLGGNEIELSFNEFKDYESCLNHINLPIKHNWSWEIWKDEALGKIKDIYNSDNWELTKYSLNNFYLLNLDEKDISKQQVERKLKLDKMKVTQLLNKFIKLKKEQLKNLTWLDLDKCNQEISNLSESLVVIWNI